MGEKATVCADYCSVHTISIGTVAEWSYIHGFPPWVSYQKVSAIQIFSGCSLYSNTSNFRRARRYNVFLKYHPRFFSRGRWWRWRAWGCCVGASTLAMGLNILLMGLGLATTVAPCDNITAKFCFSLWLLSIHWCRLKFFCACWHCQLRFLYSNC